MQRVCLFYDFDLSSYSCGYFVIFKILLLDWTGADEDQGDVNVWEDNWDDDNIEDDFSKQLRVELEKQSQQKTNENIMQQ